MRGFTRGIATVLVVAVVALGAIAFAYQTPLADAPVLQRAAGLLGDAGVTAANVALDASKIKSRIDYELRSHAGDIAAASGMSTEQVDAAIDELDIGSWKVATLPDDAKATGSFSTAYGGMSGTVTTYDDPSYVTLTTGGQDITLEVPASAQSYESLMGYL